VYKRQAPPPTFNERLYFTYKNSRDTSTVVLEVFEKLYAEKARKVPFNNKEDILDYLLSNSLNSFTEEINEMKQYNQYLLQVKKDTIGTDTLIKMLDDVELSPNFKTLLNYGKLLVKTELNNDPDSVKVTVGRIYMKRFADRHKTDSAKIQEIFFQSNFHNINE
jgi:hypothetical protein